VNNDGKGTSAAQNNFHPELVPAVSEALRSAFRYCKQSEKFRSDPLTVADSRLTFVIAVPLKDKSDNFTGMLAAVVLPDDAQRQSNAVEFGTYNQTGAPGEGQQAAEAIPRVAQRPSRTTKMGELGRLKFVDGLNEIDRNGWSIGVQGNMLVYTASSGNSIQVFDAAVGQEMSGRQDAYGEAGIDIIRFVSDTKMCDYAIEEVPNKGFIKHFKADFRSCRMAN
jgi:hypothetical protein